VEEQSSLASQRLHIQWNKSFRFAAAPKRPGK